VQFNTNTTKIEGAEGMEEKNQEKKKNE